MAKASADPAVQGAAVSLTQRALSESALQAVSAIFSGRRRLAGEQVGTSLTHIYHRALKVYYGASTQGHFLPSAHRTQLYGCKESSLALHADVNPPLWFLHKP